MHVMRAQALQNKIKLIFTQTDTRAHTHTRAPKKPHCGCIWLSEKLARAVTPSHIHKHGDNKHTEEQRPASAIRLKACQHVFPQDLLFAPQYIFLQRFIGSEWEVTF